MKDFFVVVVDIYAERERESACAEPIDTYDDLATTTMRLWAQILYNKSITTSNVVISYAIISTFSTIE